MESNLETKNIYQYTEQLNFFTYFKKTLNLSQLNTILSSIDLYSSCVCQKNYIFNSISNVSAVNITQACPKNMSVSTSNLLENKNKEILTVSLAILVSILVMILLCLVIIIMCKKLKFKHKIHTTFLDHTNFQSNFFTGISTNSSNYDTPSSLNIRTPTGLFKQYFHSLATKKQSPEIDSYFDWRINPNLWWTESGFVSDFETLVDYGNRDFFGESCGVSPSGEVVIFEGDLNGILYQEWVNETTEITKM